MDRDKSGPLFMASAAFCWSFGGLFIRLIPDAWGAMSIAGLRAALAAIVFIAWRRSAKVSLSRGNVLAALCLFATTTLFIFANILTTAAAAVLLQFTAPIFIILIHFVFYKRKPRVGEAITVAITLGGMLLFFADALEAGGTLGNFLAILSGMAFAGVFICNRREDTNPRDAVLLGFYISSAIGLPFALFAVTPDLIGWASISFLGIVQVGFAYVFFTVGIRKTPALVACLITAMEPVLNPLWVALAIGEVPGRLAILGGAVILVTVTVFNITDLKKKGS